jgi:hypothetical protein
MVPFEEEKWPKKGQKIKRTAKLYKMDVKDHP